MGSVRIRKVSDEDAREEMVDDFITRGYRVVSEGESSTRLKLRTWGSAGGHVLVLLLAGWWTLGFFNLVYAVWARAAADEVIVREVGGRDEDEVPRRGAARRW